MSLDYRLSNIHNYKQVCWEEIKDPTTFSYHGATVSKIDGKEKAMHVVTHELIWTTISIGMGDITEKNCVEFFTRWQMAHSGGRSNMLLGGKHIEITFQDVVNHIGLHTNASRKTASQFVNNIVKVNGYDLNKELKELLAKRGPVEEEKKLKLKVLA